MYDIYYTRDAKNDYKKAKYSVIQNKVIALLEILKIDPFTNPPPYKKLRGSYLRLYSRRITLKHRLFYEVDIKNKRIKILRMWSHYGDN